MDELPEAEPSPFQNGVKAFLAGEPYVGKLPDDLGGLSNWLQWTAGWRSAWKKSKEGRKGRE